ncbi:MAG: tol-pal system protein YbgF [Deltaproteobacteria bacterium]|nr:tol-pal system protein YbgF [Candidatus Tharpella sp.]
MATLRFFRFYPAIAVFIIVAASVLCGCIGTGQQREAQIIDRRLKSLEQQQAALSRKSLSARQKLNADTNIRLDNLERELKLISGSVEDALARPEEVQSIDKFELEKVIADLEKRLQQLEQGNPQTSAEKFATQSTKSQAGSKKQIVTPTPTTPSAREKALYDDAYNTFKRGDFKNAKNKFKKFIGAFPNSSYKVNSQFWIGECYYKTDDFAEAIIKYDEIIANHPQHQKAASALLKQGFAFLKLGDTTDGKLILKKVIANYPKTDQAEIAHRKLKTIK